MSSDSMHGLNINYLRIPLYLISDLDNLESFHGFNSRQMKWFKNAYTPENRNGIIQALQWASQNPEYDFKSLALNEIPYENKVVHQYLCNWYNSLKDLKF